MILFLLGVFVGASMGVLFIGLVSANKGGD